jgi:lysophospholipase L1-like esterase
MRKLSKFFHSKSLLFSTDSMSNVVEMNPRARMVCIGDSITEQGSKANGWVSHLAEAYLRKADVCVLNSFRASAHGCIALISHVFSRRINRGFSGYNTDHALVALRHMLHSSSDLHGCAVVTIMLGSNDCVKTSVQPVVSLALASQQRHEFPPIMVNCASDNCARMLSAAEVEQELASAQFVRDGETMFRTSSQHVPLPRYESNLRTMIELLRTTSPSTRVIVIAPPPINGPAWLAHMQSTYGPDFTRYSTCLFMFCLLQN